MSVRPEFAPYQLMLTKAFQKQLNRLSDQDLERIQEALVRLSVEGIGDIKDVGDDMAGAFRLRVGFWRILFDVEGRTIYIRVLEKRGEAYKRRSRNR